MTFAKLHDPGNGMVVAWVIMAAESVVIMFWAYYYQAVSPESMMGCFLTLLIRRAPLSAGLTFLRRPFVFFTSVLNP